MTALMIGVAVGMVAVSAPYVLRVLVGPTLFDRIVALNGIGTNGAVLVVVVGLLYGRPAYFVDITIGLILLNLFATLLIARYVKEKGRIPL